MNPEKEKIIKTLDIPIMEKRIDNPKREHIPENKELSIPIMKVNIPIYPQKKKDIEKTSQPGLIESIFTNIALSPPTKDQIEGYKAIDQCFTEFKLGIEDSYYIEKLKQEVKDSSIDKLFDDKEFRLALFPIKYDDLWELTKKAQSTYWVREEIDTTEDLKYLAKISTDEKLKGELIFLKGILAFQANFDVFVNRNMEQNVFVPSVTIPEAIAFYKFQELIENIHNEAYQFLIHIYIKDEKEREKLLNSANTIKEINDILVWFVKFGNDENVIIRIIVQCLIEAIPFPAGFMGAVWFRKNNKFPGFGHANELISRDEGLHCDFAYLVVNKYMHKISSEEKEKVKEMIITLTNLTKALFNYAIPVNLIGLNIKEYEKLIEFLADIPAKIFIGEKIYNTQNPYEWAELISLKGNTNFFEKRVADYERSFKEEGQFVLDTNY